MDPQQTIEALKSQLADRDARIAELEDVLQRRRAQLDELFQINPVPLFLVDGDMQIRNANQRALAALGFTPDRVLRHDFLEIIDPSWHKRLAAHLEEVRSGGRRTAEVGLLTCDGKTLFARLESMSIEEPGRGLLLVAVLVLAQDPANLQLVGDTYDRRLDRVRTLSTRYGRT